MTRADINTINVRINGIFPSQLGCEDDDPVPSYDVAELVIVNMRFFDSVVQVSLETISKAL